MASGTVKEPGNQVFFNQRREQIKHILQKDNTSHCLRGELTGGRSHEGEQQGTLLTKEGLCESNIGRKGESRLAEGLKTRWQVCVPDWTEGKGKEEVTNL